MPNRLTFRKFVKIRPVTDDPMGDFIADAREDLRRDILRSRYDPRRHIANVRTWAGLKLYLKDYGACDGAIEAARRVWIEFEEVQRHDL